MPYKLLGFANNNFAKNFKDQKSIIEYYFFLGKQLYYGITRSNKYLVSLFINKVKYIALRHVSKKNSIDLIIYQ